eukprot:5664994-Prymnesium_polylepis.2
MFETGVLWSGLRQGGCTWYCRQSRKEVPQVQSTQRGWVRHPVGHWRFDLGLSAYPTLQSKLGKVTQARQRQRVSQFSGQWIVT